MNILTVDFETYYSTEFSLTKMTTEEYVRSPEFEVIGVSVQVDDGEPVWFSGGMQETEHFLRQFDWANSFALAHNTMFDGAILTWLFDIKPKGWLDTLSMARALHGTEVGGSLKALAAHYELGAKGTEVENAKGLHRADFSKEHLAAYGEYCRNDVTLTYKLFTSMMPLFPLSELKLIDMTLRMFTEPTLELDEQVLTQHLAEVRAKKEALLEKAASDKEVLMSNPKFADLLRLYGVQPPMKISPTTGKETYAFAKNDEAFKELLDHHNPEVQALVAARLGTKSTLEETRTERFIGIAERGRLPVPLRYYAAHTGRWGGDDKLNLQNLPRSSPLKRAIVAPTGYVMIDSDSSQIEARTLAWLAGQDDLVEAFDRGEDVYRIMASAIYGKPTDSISKDERFVGKTTILGAGYGMGASKFKAQLKNFNVEVSEDEAQHIIETYRRTYPMIPELWKEAGKLLTAIIGNQTMSFGRDGLLLVEGTRGIRLPNGLYIKYPNLTQRQDPDSGKNEYVYDTKKGSAVIPNRIYGGKVVENCIAQGTLVLSSRGWIPIEKVSSKDLIHDGVEFVSHGGLVFKSVQTCVSIDGVYMTPDHEVLTDYGWKAASQNPQPYRPDLRNVDRAQSGVQRREETPLEVSLSVWKSMREGWCRRNQRGQTWRRPQLRVRDQSVDIKSQQYTRYEQASGLRRLAFYAGSLPTTFAPSMEKLRRAWDHSLHSMARVVSEFLGRHGRYISAWAGFRSHQQQWGLLPGELSMGLSAYQYDEPSHKRTSGGRSSFEQGYRHSAHNLVLQTSERLAGGSTDAPTITEKQVYDILNCGPRHRFVVKGESAPFIVHNCCQALARIVIGEQMLAIAKRYRPVMTVHDAVACVVPESDAEIGKSYVEVCMRTRPKWAPELPLNCEAGYGKSYADC